MEQRTRELEAECTRRIRERKEVQAREDKREPKSKKEKRKAKKRILKAKLAEEKAQAALAQQEAFVWQVRYYQEAALTAELHEMNLRLHAQLHAAPASDSDEMLSE